MINNFTFVEKILLKTNVIQHPLVDSLTCVIAGRALQISVSLGLTNHLGENPVSSKVLAKKLKLSIEGVEALLDSLEALGYVSNIEGKYILSKRGTKFFSKNSSLSLINTILFSNYIFESLLDLEKNVRRGGPKNVNIDVFSPKQWSIFNKTMLEIASSSASEITKLIPRDKKFKRLLDVGGSHGLYAIEYCKKLPGLTATILDLKPVEAYAKRIIKEKGMVGRVKFVVGNFLKESLGESEYDVVFAFNIIHGLNQKVNELFTKKVYKSLKSNGLYVILDQIKEARGRSELSQLVAASQGLMLFNQAGGKTYGFEEISELMKRTGFTKIKMKTLRSPGNALIFGFKQYSN